MKAHGHTLKMLVITVAMCVSYSVALISVTRTQCQIATSMGRRRLHPLQTRPSTFSSIPSPNTERELGAFNSVRCQQKINRQRVLMNAVKDVRRSCYENDDDENPKHADDDMEIDDKSGADEDDLEADEYLEQLISNAMKEEEPGTLLTERKMIAKPISFRESDLNPKSSTFGEKDSALQETKRMMEQQQQQIDLLMKLVQNQQLAPQSDKSQQSSSASTTKQKSINVTPLKVMLFIDGTWLYYSLHARKLNRCSIIPKFGKGWQANYKVDW